MLRCNLSFALALIGLLTLVSAGSAIPILPNINTNNIIVITNAAYGAVGDGVATNTTAIQNAINAAAAGGTTNGAAGGTVEIPAGIYLSGPLTMASSVNLQIDAGAILRMLPLGKYPGGTTSGTTFIYGSYLHDIEISGTGAIDGQGAPWWPYANTNGANRPRMISPSNCNRLLIQNVTLSNSPMFHIAISGTHSGNSTIQGVTIRANSSSDPTNPGHNTDACDVSGTNILVQNCNISVGDDDFTCGGGTSDVLLTNNTYGNGHGVSIGSYTQGVSNIMVINCTFNGTDNGIRIKSDNDRSGWVRNISYCNIGMTNVNFPIQVYGYYNEVGTPSSISPWYASTQAVAAVVSTTPAFRDITFSNINVTSVRGYPIGLIWARTEMPATNITFNKVNISGDRNFYLYNVVNAQFIDCNLKTTATSNTFALFNANFTVTNTAASTNLVMLEGLTTNGYGNSMAFYNARVSLKNTNALAASSGITLGGSIFSVTNNLSLPSSSVVNFVLGTNATTMVVASNLALSGTVNVSAGTGFTNTSYTLFTCGKTLTWGPPVLGATPTNFICSFDTNTAGQVKLTVTLSAPSAPTNLTATGTNLLIKLKWNAVSGAASYNLKRGTANGGPYPTVYSGLTVTNYSDAAVTNAVTYYYVVTTVSGSESANSLQAGAAPLPSSAPANIVAQVSSGQLQLSWPLDHLGWRLQIQTNDLNQGFGTNWVTVPNSTNTCQTSFPVNPANGSVFLRLVYP